MTHIIIPIKIFEDENLSDQHKLFYGWLNFKANKNGYLWHTNETIVYETNKLKRDIQRYLKKLEENRYIYKDEKAKNKALYPGIFTNKDGKQTLYWDVVKGKRVIWIYESWLKANDDLKYPKHPTRGKPSTPPAPTKQDYSKFQREIRNDYADEVVMLINDDQAIGIDILGKLVKCDHQGNIITYLGTDEALRIWRYMFTNPMRLLNPGTGERLHP